MSSTCRQRAPEGRERAQLLRNGCHWCLLGAVELQVQLLQRQAAEGFPEQGGVLRRDSRFLRDAWPGRETGPHELELCQVLQAAELAEPGQVWGWAALGQSERPQASQAQHGGHAAGQRLLLEPAVQCKRAQPLCNHPEHGSGRLLQAELAC